MWTDTNNTPIDLDINIYSQTVVKNDDNMDTTIWDEIDLDKFQMAGIMQHKLNLSGAFDLPTNHNSTTNELPPFKGIKSLAMVNDRLQTEWLGITRAAATGNYEIEWQNWCGYETSPEKLIGKRVQVLGLIEPYELNETCGVIISYDIKTCRFRMKPDVNCEEEEEEGVRTILNVSQNNLFYEFVSPYCCPFTPLCKGNGICCHGTGECSWVNIRQLIICAWYVSREEENEKTCDSMTADADDIKPSTKNKNCCFFNNFPKNCIQNILSFARPHRRPNVLDFTDTCRIKIKWKDPNINNLKKFPLKQNEIDSTSATGRAGTSIIEFYDSISLAMELHCMIAGYDESGDIKSKDYTFLEESCIGRLARLECYHKLFWSLILHYQEFHTCFPIMKIPNEYKVKASGGGILGLKGNLTAEVFIYNDMRLSLPEDLVSIIRSSSQELTNSEFKVIFPVWLKRVKVLIDHAFKTMFDGFGEASSIGCIFYNSDAGCASPPGFHYPSINNPASSSIDNGVSCGRQCGQEFGPCKFLHDSWWKNFKEDIIKHPRICITCGKYGLLKCSRCQAVYYCSGACQKKSWKIHKRSCAPKT